MTKYGENSDNCVYKWENKVVHPVAGNVKFNSVSEAQSFVDFIWTNEGRTHPPKVVLNKEGRVSTGSRTTLHIRENHLNYHVIVHELCHALTTDTDGYSAQHGPIYARCYINMLSKYLNMNKAELEKSAASNKVVVMSEEDYNKWYIRWMADCS